MCVRFAGVDVDVVGQKRHLVGVKSSSSDSGPASSDEEEDSELSLAWERICDSKTEWGIGGSEVIFRFRL